MTDLMLTKKQQYDQDRYYGRKERGVCIRCGRPRDCRSEVYCLRHLRQQRLKVRKLKGCRPQYCCGMGRPTMGTV